MQTRRGLSRGLLLATGVAVLLVFAALQNSRAAGVTSPPITQGSLSIVDAEGKPRGVCPLRHTDVRAEISGFLSRVTVTQEFENPFDEKIEAVYAFPLPAASAVDDMTMRVGERTVRGRILRREEAQAVYATARSAGQVASLLDQERPNIFTQSVANIMPGAKVTVTISYVETLKYEDGSYEFSFPMVVGPRYIPGTPSGTKQGGGREPDTNRVPDASRITPQVAPEGTRAGHDISLEVKLDAGVPLDAVRSVTHEIEDERPAGATSALVRLKNKSTIPNKDFILRYDVAGRKIADAVLAHRTSRGGFFTLILQPPERIAVEDVMPKELVFVLDTSGSMEGFPIKKAKETMNLALDGLYPQDTFNLITFAGDTHVLFPQPVAATPENLKRARKFLSSRKGGGGTEMMKAIRAALDPSDAQGHVRIVCFMTDAYVGNEGEIISEIQKHPNARVFAFGIGSSVNRHLLDKMAEHGRGEVEYVTPNDDGSAAARRFHERVRNPLLTDISIDWAGLPVADVYPKRIPDLFGAKPVRLTGRYTGGGRGRILLRGMMAGRAFVREIDVTLPEAEARHDVLATLWARARIDDVTSEDFEGIQQGNAKFDVRETITQLGLEYRLMTPFTSFVAVEEMTFTDGGEPRRIDVPVELPEGVNRANTVGVGESVLVSSSVNYSTIQMLSTSSESVSVMAESSSGIDLNSSTLGRTFNQDDMVLVGGGGTVKPMPRRSRPARSSAGKDENGNKEAGAAGLSAEEKRKQEQREQEQRAQAERARMLAKLHPSLVAVIDRLNRKDAVPAAEEVAFVRDGKAEVQIWLNEKSPEALAALRELGFELVLEPQSAKLVIGRLPAEKLVALAALEVVRYVAPQKKA